MITSLAHRSVVAQVARRLCTSFSTVVVHSYGALSSACVHTVTYFRSNARQISLRYALQCRIVYALTFAFQGHHCRLSAFINKSAVTTKKTPQPKYTNGILFGALHIVAVRFRVDITHQYGNRAIMTEFRSTS